MLKNSHIPYATFVDLNVISPGGPQYLLNLVSEKKKCEWAVRLNCEMS